MLEEVESRMNLLAIAGKAGTGKDTLAGYLKELGWVSMAFADPLYDALQAMFGITREQMQDRAFKERVIPWIGKSPRELLQTLGTEWGRERVGNELWVNHLARRVESARAARTEDSFYKSSFNFITAPVGIVITDVRMENEAEWVRSHGGTVLHLTRPALGEVRAHSSEAGVAWKVGDLVYHNRGTLEQLGKMALLAGGVAGEYKKAPAKTWFDSLTAGSIDASKITLGGGCKIVQYGTIDEPKLAKAQKDFDAAIFNALRSDADYAASPPVITGIDPAKPGGDATCTTKWAASASGLSLLEAAITKAADDIAGMPEHGRSSRINGTSSVPPFPVLFSAPDHLRSTRKPRELRHREILGGWCNAECNECSLVRCEHNPSFRGAK